jgi:hypothetical protein
MCSHCTGGLIPIFTYALEMITTCRRCHWLQAFDRTTRMASSITVAGCAHSCVPRGGRTVQGGCLIVTDQDCLPYHKSTSQSRHPDG